MDLRRGSARRRGSRPDRPMSPGRPRLPDGPRAPAGPPRWRDAGPDAPSPRERTGPATPIWSSCAPTRNQQPPRTASSGVFSSSSNPSRSPKNRRASSSQPGGAASWTWSRPVIEPTGSIRATDGRRRPVGALRRSRAFGAPRSGHELPCDAWLDTEIVAFGELDGRAVDRERAREAHTPDGTCAPQRRRAVTIGW